MKKAHVVHCVCTVDCIVLMYLNIRTNYGCNVLLYNGGWQSAGRTFSHLVQEQVARCVLLIYNRTEDRKPLPKHPTPPLARQLPSLFNHKHKWAFIPKLIYFL